MPYIPPELKGAHIPDEKYWEDCAEELQDCVEICALSHEETVKYITEYLGNCQEDSGQNVNQLSEQSRLLCAMTIADKLIYKAQIHAGLDIATFLRDMFTKKS